jgi:hypothetical protein
MESYLVYFTSKVEAYVPVEANSKREAMEIFDSGAVSFEDMIEISSETSAAEYAELEDDEGDIDQ